MRLRWARVQNYRSIKDSSWFELDEAKTILLGPNEGGKTALLRALEQLNAAHSVRGFEPLRDFPRSEYHRVQSGEAVPSEVVVVEGEYELDEQSRLALDDISPLFAQCRYHRAVHLDNSVSETLVQGPTLPTVGTVKDALRALAAHADARTGQPPPSAGAPGGELPVTATELLEQTLGPLPDAHAFSAGEAQLLLGWLDRGVAPYVDPSSELETSRLAALREALKVVADTERVIEEFRKHLPVMVYVSTYPSVTPILHLGHLADAIEAGAVDEADEYNFGNLCLLRLLGFSARELSDLGKAREPEAGDVEGFERYRRQLDERDAALNTASLRLTNQIRTVWATADDALGGERLTVRITADQQYLKVVVEDSLGVQIELDQRSQGFKWLVSFFIIFFAQASDRNREAVLLLDEPGMSLHGLKQREFRHTLSRLGTANQLVFTTHSPFLVGAEELDRVRLVELTDRAAGTQVRGDLAAGDPSSLLPLQEAVGFDLAAALFSNRKTLLFESLADYWVFQATAALLEDASMGSLDRDIALLPLTSLSRMVYFATLLHADGLRVAALLDTEPACLQGDRQQRLLELLDDKQVLRTKDLYEGPVVTPRIEELLRQTLIVMAEERGWDVSRAAGEDWGARPIGQVLADAVGPELTGEALAKAYVAWTRDHVAADLTAEERASWMRLVEKANQALA